MAKDKDQDLGFKVNDRRMSMDDSPEESPAPAPKEQPKAAPPHVEKELPKRNVEPVAPAEPNMESPVGGAKMPPIDFRQFIMSLATSALIQMGEAQAPDGESYIDLEAARQTIDILDMLKIKTKGNLDKNEESIMEGVLHELRMRFVAKTKTVK